MCPKCGCKVCYNINEPEDYKNEYDEIMRCANCGYTFDIEEADDDDFENESDEQT